jgi:hypothetical protein
MFYKVKNVRPLPDYSLLVEFANNEKKQYDVSRLIKEFDPFKVLSYVPGLFEQVKVEPGGYAVSWNSDIDLACNELYINGV